MGAVEMPSWIGGAVRVAWPVALLLLFAAAFRSAGAGDRASEIVEEHAGRAGRYVAAGAVECEQPGHLDVAVLEGCLAVQPDDIELMLDLGAAYQSRGRWADAERVYGNAVAMDPSDGDAHLGLGRALLARGDVAAARREGDAALAIQPGSPEALRLAQTNAGRAGP